MVSLKVYIVHVSWKHDNTAAYHGKQWPHCCTFRKSHDAWKHTETLRHLLDAQHVILVQVLVSLCFSLLLTDGWGRRTLLKFSSVTCIYVCCSTLWSGLRVSTLIQGCNEWLFGIVSGVSRASGGDKECLVWDLYQTLRRLPSRR